MHFTDTRTHVSVPIFTVLIRSDGVYAQYRPHHNADTLHTACIVDRAHIERFVGRIRVPCILNNALIKFLLKSKTYIKMVKMKSAWKCFHWHQYAVRVMQSALSILCDRTRFGSHRCPHSIRLSIAFRGLYYFPNTIAKNI